MDKEGKKRRPAWFTLAELIVVIAVLAILATVGFLALQGYSRDAKDAAAKANVRSVMTAVSSESALTGNSPRYYVVHDPAAALTGAVAFVDGSPVALTGGQHGTDGANYSAGNPDWAKLRLDPDKFRVSSLADRLASAFGTAGAAYSPTGVSVGAFEYALASRAGGKARAGSYFQVAAVLPETGLAVVAGTYPEPPPGGYVRGLVRDSAASSQTGALVDGAVGGAAPGSSSGSTAGGTPALPFVAGTAYSAGQRFTVQAAGQTVTVTVSSAAGNGSGTGTASSQYLPGTPDIAVWSGSTVQVWAPVNAGATEVYAGQPYPTATWARTEAQKGYMGALYQWGRNDDVTTGTSTGTKAPAGTSAGGLVGTAWSGTYVTSWSPFDWISTQNGNLWGGSWSTTATGTFASLGSPAAMRGPCADGYHVPTQKEWCDAIMAVSPEVTACDAVWYVEATANKFMNTLKLPLAGYRTSAAGALSVQGTNGLYWASSPSGARGHAIGIAPSNGIYPSNNPGRSDWLSVRCLAN